MKKTRTNIICIVLLVSIILGMLPQIDVNAKGTFIFFDEVRKIGSEDKGVMEELDNYFENGDYDYMNNMLYQAFWLDVDPDDPDNELHAHPWLFATPKVLKKLLNAGFLWEYIDEMKSINAIPEDFTPSFKSKVKINVKKGRTYHLYFYDKLTYSSYMGVKWTSSNKSIATVSKCGKVKGKKNGKCKITASVNLYGVDYKYECSVTVGKKQTEAYYL